MCHSNGRQSADLTVCFSPSVGRKEMVSNQAYRGMLMVLISGIEIDNVPHKRC